MSEKLNSERLLNRILEAVQEKTTHDEYVQKLIREDVARKEEARAYAEAEELIGWRKLAEAAIDNAKLNGSDARCISYLRDWQDKLIAARTDKQWQELEERLPF